MRVEDLTEEQCRALLALLDQQASGRPSRLDHLDRYFGTSGLSDGFLARQRLAGLISVRPNNTPPILHLGEYSVSLSPLGLTLAQELRRLQRNPEERLDECKKRLLVWIGSAPAHLRSLPAFGDSSHGQTSYLGSVFSEHEIKAAASHLIAAGLISPSGSLRGSLGITTEGSRHMRRMNGIPEDPAPIYNNYGVQVDANHRDIYSVNGGNYGTIGPQTTFNNNHLFFQELAPWLNDVAMLAATVPMPPDVATTLISASNEMRTEMARPNPRESAIRTAGRRIVEALPAATASALVAGAHPDVQGILDFGRHIFGGF